MNEISKISTERVRQHILTRFNPIRNLTPELLASHLDSWQSGYLRSLALVMETIEERDDVLKGVVGKRKRAASRHSWEVRTVDDSAEAKRQAEALKGVFNRLVASHALDGDQRGGMKLLIRQMMDAIGKRYAVHELIWSQGARGQGRGSMGGDLRVECKFVPLWFFEATEGRLRFLPQDTAVYGLDLEPDGWMVTVGDGLMIASSICYMFKRLPLQDWLSFCEKFGMPGIVGKTDATKGSEEWDNLVAMVGAWANDLAAVCSRSSDIELTEAAKNGDGPFAPLIERMDRAMAALWRGGDLGTLSKDGAAVGSNPQLGEVQILEEDDCDLIAETIQERIARPALRYLFGDDTEPLAYIELMPDPKSGAAAVQAFKREVWKQFQMDGTVSDVLANQTNLRQLTEDVGLPIEAEYVEPWLPVKDDQGNMITGEVVTDAEGDVIGGKAESRNPNPESRIPKGIELANEGDAAGKAAVLQAVAMDLQPWRERLAAILQISDPVLMEARLRGLLGEIEQLKKDIGADPAMAREIEGIIAQGLVQGMVTTKDTKDTKA